MEELSDEKISKFPDTEGKKRGVKKGRGLGCVRQWVEERGGGGCCVRK